MDLPTFANAPREVTLAGSVYRVSALRLRDWAAVQQWIKDNVPSPLAILEDPIYARLPAEERSAIRKQAIQDRKAWPPLPGSRAWFEALDHEGGHAEFLRCLLSVHQTCSPERAAELAGVLTQGEVVPLLLAALGVEDTGPPKAGAPGATPEPTGAG